MKKNILTQPLRLLVLTLLLSFMAATAANGLDFHDCNFCHDLHNAPGDYLLSEINFETLCMSCHDGTTSAPEVNVHGNSEETLANCIDCHARHSNVPNYLGGSNTSLVGYKIAGDAIAKIMNNNPEDPDGGFEEYFNVAFEEGSRVFWDPDQRTDTENNARRVCQLCHRVPTRGTHPKDIDCTARCHTHANGFLRGGTGMP